MPDDEVIARVESRFNWDLLPAQDRLEFMLGEPDPIQWFSQMAMQTFTHYRYCPVEWGQITAQALALRLSPARLEAAVDAWIESHPAPPAQASRRPPPLPVTEAPHLPAGTRCLVAPGQVGAWLEQYVEHSQRWSPRGIPSAHVAIGLWVLSTIAARRVYCQVGSSEVYPVLFLAMVARSTLYAKSTTAAIGKDVLRRAGCGYLLTADRTTPQALMKSMSGAVPANYGNQTDDQQQTTRQRLAFAGQRGAYFEEWGGMLNQMRRTDSPMAEFHTLLRVLDDNQATYSNDTIQRGLERIDAPYLALLASATPHDLRPFMKPGSAWWHDGFWPRFIFIIPPSGQEPSLAQRQRTGYQIPGSLLLPLINWHTRLGIPTATIDAMVDAKGKPTGAWQATTTPLPSQELGIAENVYDAYEAYNSGLLTLLRSGDVPQDYDASYGRFHEKALRLALLLASLAGDTTITIQHWSYAQNITEAWRRNLHALTGDMEEESEEHHLEQKLIDYLTRAEEATARELHRLVRTLSSTALASMLAGMVKAGHLHLRKEGKRELYTLFPHDFDTSSENDGIPF